MDDCSYFCYYCCTACGKENAEQKMMTSVLEAEYINDYWNNGIQFLHFQISDALKMAEEQSDDLAEKEAETVKADEKSTEDDAVISKEEEESNEKEWDVDFEIALSEVMSGQKEVMERHCIAFCR